MVDDLAQGRVRVSILALRESTPTALYGLYEVFSSVGVTWPMLMGGEKGDALFDVRIVSRDGNPFVSTTGIPVAPNASIRANDRSDIIFVTDLDLTHEFRPRSNWPEETDWINRQYENGATICSVCTGAVLLADAGILDGRDATTHWSACDLFSTFYPDVRLKPERVVVPTGAEHRIVTSGGAASWEDLALQIIARFCGQAEAIRTSKVFLLGDRSEGQLPFATTPKPKNHSDGVIAKCQEWAAEHYMALNPVARMATLSGLAERTFKRRFRAATGYAPMDYIQTLRIEEAKQILETTDMPTDHVAHEVGYEDPTYFRRLFKKRTGTTPSRYRQRFQSIARPSIQI